MPKRTTFFIALALLLAVPASAAAAPPSDLIRLGRGMAGISLGQTQAQVKDVLGEPASTKKGSNEFGKYTILKFRGKLTVTFQGNRQVTSISTTDEGQRTTTGIRVDSTESELRSKISGVKCESFDGRRICTSWRLEPGQRATSFFLSASGRINRISVGIVID